LDQSAQHERGADLVSFPRCRQRSASAGQLLADGLVACANIMPEMESLFMWEGRADSTQRSRRAFQDHAINTSMPRSSGSARCTPMKRLRLSDGAAMLRTH
jgi:hypothetical protein